MKSPLPLALDLMLKMGGQLGGESIWFYSKYITFSLQLLLAFGLAFQLPVVILILGKMGLVGSDQLREASACDGGAFDFGDALNAT